MATAKGDVMIEELSEDRKRAHAAKAERRDEQAALPIKEKVRQLLEMQRLYLPIIAQRRPLEWWEKPWDIDP